MTLRTLALATFLSAIAGSQVFAQNLVWEERAPLTLPRAGYMAGVIDNKYVIAGGSYWAEKKKHWTDRVDIFDPRSNTWSKAAPLPGPRSDAGVVSFANALYIFGGGANDSARRDTLVFRGGKWLVIPEAELPEPRVYSVGVVSGGRVYLLGGLSKPGDYTTIKSTFWVWNPRAVKEGWHALQPMPGPGLISHAMAEVNGKIYVLGGAKTGGKDVVNARTSYVFDTQTETWAKLPDLPVERRCWWGVGIDSRILLIGGYTATYERDVFAYSPATHTLTAVGQMPHGICDAKFFRLENYVIGTGGEVGDAVRGQWTLAAPLSSGKARK